MRNATFCDILHETKQKSKNKVSRVRSTDWKSALNPCSKILRFVFLLQIQAGMNSLYNTPPTYSIYMMGLVFKWLKRNGGIKGSGSTFYMPYY